MPSGLRSRIISSSRSIPGRSCPWLPGCWKATGSDSSGSPATSPPGFGSWKARRGGPLAWREWIELVAELAEWEVRLGQAEEPGLQDALRTLQDSLRQDFARYLQRNYAGWLHEGDSDRPPLSVDIGAEFLRPVLDLHGRAMLVVVDCLRLDQWAMIRPLISARFDIETAHYFSILPTATPFARNAIFSGLFPGRDQVPLPQWWNDNEDASLNAHEAELLTRAHAGAHRPQRAGALREGVHRLRWGRLCSSGCRRIWLRRG